MTPKEIGQLIRTRRENLGMSQAQLADAVKVSESAIAMYEAGRRMPKPSTQEALADVFNVPKWAIRYSEDEVIPKTEDDDDLMQMREDMRRNPELRVIFDLQRKATKTELRQMKAFIQALRSGNEAEDDNPA